MYSIHDTFRHVGSSKTSVDCKLHFEEFYVQDATGDFNCFAIDTSKITRSTRVDEPISCAMPIQEFTAAPFGAPIRPMAGSITFKGNMTGEEVFILNQYEDSNFWLGNITTIKIFVFILELAGYNAARGDFDAEFDNGMELSLNDIEVDGTMYDVVNNGGSEKQSFKNLVDENEETVALIAQLSVAMLEIYKRKLRARRKRKR